MGFDAGNDIIEPVAIDVVGVHLSATTAKFRRMFDPFGIAFEGLGLLPPATRLKDVLPTVAIHIAVAIAVSKLLPSTFGRNLVERPGLCGVAPVGSGITEITAGMEND